MSSLEVLPAEYNHYSALICWSNPGFQAETWLFIPIFPSDIQHQIWAGIIRAVLGALYLLQGYFLTSGRGLCIMNVQLSMTGRLTLLRLAADIIYNLLGFCCSTFECILQKEIISFWRTHNPPVDLAVPKHENSSLSSVSHSALAEANNSMQFQLSQ